ncbi:hypothetical protein LC087_02625 [Bacillus carboniphilus]|uniref:Cadherin domain-containing protein n=1 Tax=Bacillus carboniphilus TaxID=86663 RepID=A0ABY9JUP6_9BACI|nr:hypothetical protein [Bacillus carboniphilus]WLR43121.1 hypothetical protein LC087_02625 [Bacillus carboniphilus]
MASIVFTSGNILNNSFFGPTNSVLIRNTDPNNAATVSYRLYDVTTSPQTLVNQQIFSVSVNTTEEVIFDPTSLTEFAIDLRVDMNNRSESIMATAVQPTFTLFDGDGNIVQFERFFVSRPRRTVTISL